MWHTTKITTIQARTHLKSKALKMYRKDRKSKNITENPPKGQNINRNDRKSKEMTENQNLQILQKINRNGRKLTDFTGEKIHSRQIGLLLSHLPNPKMRVPEHSMLFVLFCTELGTLSELLIA